MEMAIYVFDIVFIVCFLIFLFIYLKRNTLKNIWCAVTNIFTFGESYLLTKIFSFICGSKIAKVFEYVLNKSLNIEEEWSKTNSIDDFINFTSTILINVILFILIFVVLYFINHLIKRMIFKKVYSEKYSLYTSKKNNILVSCCALIVSFLVITFSFLYPFGAFVDIIHTSANYAGYAFSEKEEKVVGNEILKVYSYIGSKTFFDSVTYFNANDGKVKNSKEMEGLLTISYAIINISKEKDVISNTNKIKESLTNTYLIPSLISEVCSNAALRFKNNQSFMGMNLKIPNNASKEFYIELLDVVSKWNKESLIKNIDTIFELYEILYSNNILQITKVDDLINVISKDEFNERLFLCLFKNDDLKTLLPKFVNYGISSVFDKLNIKTDSKNYLKVDDINSLTEDDIKNEAKIFSLIVRQVVKIGEYNGKDIPKDDFVEILNNLSEIQNSKIFNNLIYNTLLELLNN